MANEALERIRKEHRVGLPINTINLQRTCRGFY
jgi:hypothetical protein